MLTCAILMLLSTVALYFYTKTVLQHEAEEELYSTEARIENALKMGKQPFLLPPVIEVSKAERLLPFTVKDTIIYDPSQDEMEVFRELTTYKKINRENYKIVVRSLEVESKDILAAVVASYVVIILLTFVFLFYFNTAGNKLLWKPFFENLDRLKQFSLTSKQSVKFQDSQILEFSELNKQIELLTQKVSADYENLKQFTEDVSHEIQTPLAIIQAKIENLINYNAINDEQYQQLTSIQKDIKRLTQLNKRLTLLTKIDNSQYAQMEEVDILKLIEKSIQNFSELSAMKLEFVAKNNLVVKMDPYLSEILCNNLISNAIKHTGGTDSIHIKIEGNNLSISNFGNERLQRPEKLFQRFYREARSSQSSGLGLAIAKKICDLYGFRVSYQFEDNRHIFTVSF